MIRAPQPQVPASYRLRIAGHLDHHWAAWFGDLELNHEDDGTTSLTGVVSDQAELHGLLTKIRDLGVILISVAVVDPPDGSGVGLPTSPPAANGGVAPGPGAGRGSPYAFPRGFSR